MTQESSKIPQPSQRLASIDAYRGLVMLLMMGEVLEFKAVAAANKGSQLWEFLAYHQSHTEWIGCSLHDMIQPSFSFLVGVAMPFSLASRQARGQSVLKMTRHAVWRAVMLTLLGVIMRFITTRTFNYTLEDTLSQIGLGYFFLFLLGLRPTRDQWIALAIILFGYWAAFALWPLPPAGFDYSQVGVPAGWLANHGLSGFAAHWNKNSNLAWAADTWLLNLFPRPDRFLYNKGGYATLSFIPTLGTMILGLLAGGVLRSSRTAGRKIVWLAVTGVLSIGAGWALGHFGICPIVKRIWTPSWTLFSGGLCFIFLAAFYAIMDAGRYRGWAFPMLVIGMNSIAAYCATDLFKGPIRATLYRVLGNSVFTIFGSYEPLMAGGCVLLLLWLMLFWMHRKRVFLRL